MTSMSKKAVGICKCHYAVLTVTPQENGNDLISYGTPVKIPDLEEISITESYAEGKNYADNICNIAVKIVNNADISMTFSNVSRKIRNVDSVKNVDTMIRWYITKSSQYSTWK